ncbi:hypothetical protein U732_1096 [Clostridium argentinense CDC 2741]|uniref:DUF1351 domain-containing protein n=1 Tax=Clostridium argentinense CDC 2741 TaxID=1418104 RepID=A0A0C1R1I8_9CLOT|nr:DUF1351 domain-containing protein [Clostridium argentinense]ARC85664.1 hypothetical protein RSJ17_14685 [Clostridium argentinense]KIE47262.1 hypothetical protein U732_1096 [Clostridium argentinense CDC 2741]NFF40813.1 DUF1351 domain-containing protein [Clostridium argentinense]NFP50745.1 DUF1351 domain-containing protein [Clostridium argentinense]NFP73098.1 DUF1351 domain-containing protein [Clostridium argentinense]
MRKIELNKQLPVITMNFEEVKNSLADTVEKYKGIIVTEEGLQDCKATQKELAGLRIKIDNYRKEIKKEMSKPIDAFENQCKELVKLIADAEEPIKKGILVFDNARREEKRKVALSIISEVAKEHQLSEKYVNKLNVLDKYMNLTAKPSEVKKDIEQRILILLQEQKRELEMLEIIKDTIENANKDIKTHLKIEDFKNLINMNIPTNKIIQEINKRAEIIREAEKPKPVETPKVEEEIKQEPVKQPVSMSISPNKEHLPKENQEEPLYCIELRVVGTREYIAQLGQYLKDNNYNYTKLKAGLVK